MSDANNWQWQIFAEDIHQAQQILGMVEQAVIPSLMATLAFW